MMGIGVVRFERNGFIVACQRILIPLQLLQNSATVAVSFGKVRFQGYGFVKTGERIVMPSHCLQGNTPVVVDCGAVGNLGENEVVNIHGSLEIPKTLLLDRQGIGICNRMQSAA